MHLVQPMTSSFLNVSGSRLFIVHSRMAVVYVSAICSILNVHLFVFNPVIDTYGIPLYG